MFTLFGFKADLELLVQLGQAIQHIEPIWHVGEIVLAVQVGTRTPSVKNRQGRQLLGRLPALLP